MANSGARRGTSVSCDVDDAAFRRGLQDALDRRAIKSKEGLTRLGLRVQNAARELAPVDTGRLRSSIRMISGEDADGFYVEVGTNVEYAVFVEYGTTRAAAQPFLRPALAEAVGYAASELGGS